MTEVVLTAGMVGAIALMCVFVGLQIYASMLDLKREKKLNEVVDMYHEVQKLKYSAIVEDLEGESDVRDRNRK